MSNGDSLDGFVFPPFIPTASTRPAQTPPPVPQPPAQHPSPEAAAEAASGRMTMPWDLETPIVRQPDASPAQLEAASAADDDEDLPWLEVPPPREAAAPAAEAPPAPAGDDAFPDWLAWDQRDETAAEADVRDTVAPIPGLEDFVPADDLGVAPSPVEWAETAPSSEEWSLSTPEAAEPPPVTEVPLPTWEESPAAAEPSFEISVDEADPGVIEVEPAAPAAEPQPFVADEEAVLASEPEPAVAPAGPDPFTAASVAEAQAAAPTEAVDAGSPFDDVAARLEEIARMLRDRPDELLAGGSPDPLALLVTGYVMGYTARGGR